MKGSFLRVQTGLHTHTNAVTSPVTLHIAIRKPFKLTISTGNW